MSSKALEDELRALFIKYGYDVEQISERRAYFDADAQVWTIRTEKEEGGIKNRTISIDKLTFT